MNKQRIMLLLLVLTVTVLSGCKKNKDKDITDETATATEELTAVPTTTAAPTKEPENHDNEVKSRLTGLWIPKESGNNRPYAIMFNNIKYASPQSGTAQADILYEALAEGGITRLMGIFDELDENRIGSVRSARHYFVSIADEYDAIYVHFGETTYATKKIKALGIDNLSGLTGIGDTVFYRDKSIKAPHNAFTSKKGILEGTKKSGYRVEHEKDYENHFTFHEADAPLPGTSQNAGKVSLKFSGSASPYFTYDEKEKIYTRYQFDTAHIDKNTGKPLEFKNIIVQFVKEWNIDKNGYQTMDIENATGKGYYITNGKKVDITWTKNESTKKMRYYEESGKELTMNPGKTYIAIFPNDRVQDIVLADK